MEVHPLAELMPQMSLQQFDGFKADIAANGLRVEILLFEGKILDGRHRFRACKELGIEPRFEEFNGTDEAAAAAAASLNLSRRNATKAQLAISAVKVKEWLAIRAKQRQLAALKKGSVVPVVEHVPERDEGRSRDAAAKMFGLSGRYVDEAAEMVRAAIPEVVEKVEAGEMSVNEATAISRMSKSHQKAVVDMPRPQRKKAIAKSAAISSSKKRASDFAHLKQAADAPGSAHVRFMLSRLELITNEIEKSALGAQQYAAKFVSEFDWSDPALTTRLSYVSPAIEAIASLAVIGQRARREAA